MLLQRQLKKDHFFKIVSLITHLKKELSTREQSTQSSEATEKGTQSHSHDEFDSQETLVKMETDVNQESKLDVKTQEIEKVNYEVGYSNFTILLLLIY